MTSKCLTTISLLLIYSLSFAQLPDEFTWENAHGKDWISSGKNQRWQGPCNVFASIAMTEARYALEYNNASHRDLSEFHIYSTVCSNFPAEFMVIEDALKVLKSRGAVNESCVPFPNYCANGNTRALGFSPSSPNNCDFPCGQPNHKIDINGYSDVRYKFNSDDNIKKTLLYNGPIAINITGVSALHNNATHAYLLIGWRTSCGNTEWQLKDSWPSTHPTCEPNGHTGSRIYYIDIDLPAIKSSHKLNDAWIIPRSQSLDYYTFNGNPVDTWTKNNPSVNCPGNYDQDGDGYDFWGFGPSPGSCANGPIDLDDTDPNSGYITSSGNVVNGSTTSASCPSVSWSNIVSVGNYYSLCPSEYYNFYVNVPGATQYSWSLEGQAHFTTGTNGSSVGIYTHSNFGRVSFSVDVYFPAPCCEWRTITRTWYTNGGYGCGGGGWYHAEGTDGLDIYPNPLGDTELNISTY